MAIQTVTGYINRTLLATLVLAVTLAGCESNPSGRAGIGETMEDETESRKILPTALTEFSDQVARQLTADLADLPRLRDVEGKVTILFGDLNNKTRVTPTSDFELMTQRMRDILINSDFARQHVRFYADRERMRRLARREGVGSRPGAQGPGPYDPQNTFVLLGDFYRVRRGDVGQYMMRFELSHFATGQTVFSNRYDIKQVQND